MKKTLFVLALLAARPVFSAELSGLQRIDAWQTAEKYQRERENFSNRYSKWVHEPGNENKTQVEALREEALRLAGK